MARTIDTIFNEMITQKRENTALASLTSSSATAIWRLMFYVVAFAIYVHETLWDEYRNEVNTAIDEMIPHRPKWYRDKTLAFMKNKTLIPDTDQYDTSEMSEDDIEAARVVKHATANESNQSSLLVIKVAGVDQNDPTKRAPIGNAEALQLAAYLQEIKDAGLACWIISIPASHRSLHDNLPVNGVILEELDKGISFCFPCLGALCRVIQIVPAVKYHVLFHSLYLPAPCLPGGYLHCLYPVVVTSCWGLPLNLISLD